jgi:hypothetical protein
LKVYQYFDQKYSRIFAIKLNLTSCIILLSSIGIWVRESVLSDPGHVFRVISQSQ